MERKSWSGQGEARVERIDKLLASTGRWSRKEAKQLCRQGRVTAEGVRVQAEDKASEAAALAVDGQPVEGERTVWLMLHKPAGVVSATEDREQPTVLSLLPERYRKMKLFPVGRLDKDTEGLLLLTNDGDLAHRLLSPKKHVDKVYYARLDRPLSPADCAAFEQGILLADGTRCRPAELRLLGDGREALITLREGKFHQVKRMTASRGAAVLYLKRLSMGPLELDGALAPGNFRFLTATEVAEIGGIT